MIHNLSGNDDPILKIGTFTVSEEWINKPFKLTVKDSKNYILTLPNGTAKEGRVGTPLKINNETVLKVDQILAETEQDFELTKFSKLSAIENIKNQLSVISKGKTSPIINLAYTDVDPKKTSAVLNSIADNYVAQNRERDIQVARKQTQCLPRTRRFARHSA